MVSDKPFNLQDDVQLAEALSLATPINARPVRKSMIWSLAQRNADLQEVYRLETNGALNLAAAVTTGVPSAAVAVTSGAFIFSKMTTLRNLNGTGFFGRVAQTFRSITRFVQGLPFGGSARAIAKEPSQDLGRRLQGVCRGKMLPVCAVGVTVGAVAATAGAMFVGNQLSEKAQQTFSDPTRLKAMEAALTEIDSLRTVHESNARGVKTYIEMLKEFDRTAAASVAPAIGLPCPSPSDVMAETRNLNQNSE
ncbi:MAG: hypothetical protein IOD12_17775 [Silvanigrellales bacterium]|nr:hypothetical protein [Silvanigrellales bacterium]